MLLSHSVCLSHPLCVGPERSDALRSVAYTATPLHLGRTDALGHQVRVPGRRGLGGASVPRTRPGYRRSPPPGTREKSSVRLGTRRVAGRSPLLLFAPENPALRHLPFFLPFRSTVASVGWQMVRFAIDPGFLRTSPARIGKPRRPVRTVVAPSYASLTHGQARTSSHSRKQKTILVSHDVATSTKTLRTLPSAA